MGHDEDRFSCQWLGNMELSAGRYFEKYFEELWFEEILGDAVLILGICNLSLGFNLPHCAYP